MNSESYQVSVYGTRNTQSETNPVSDGKYEVK